MKVEMKGRELKWTEVACDKEGRQMKKLIHFIIGLLASFFLFASSLMTAIAATPLKLKDGFTYPKASEVVRVTISQVQ